MLYNDVSRAKFTGGRTLVRSHTAVNGVLKQAGTITVFSVPHYDGGNRGAFLFLKGSMVDTHFFTTPRHAWIDSQPIF